MSEKLIFDDQNYEVRTVEWEGRSVTFRAFENLVYVERPVASEFQKLNLFVPEVFYQGGSINGFTKKTAPIFFPNAIGAYMSGRADVPGMNFRSFARDQINSLFVALEKGFVVAAPAARGLELEDEQGKFIGVAPAAIVDLKAAVRYLRYNRERIPGNVERIISDGTSAGGAMSALLGASGNSADYEPYLRELGAAEERDDIYGAICFCPIMNLEHADMAYEWLLEGQNEYHSVHFRKENGLVVADPYEGSLTPIQLEASRNLRAEFIKYLNSLKLRTEEGQALTLDENGRGTFRDYLADFMKHSAQTALDKGENLDGCSYLTVAGGSVVSFDLDAYVAECGRMKPTPAFDEWACGNAENQEFGTAMIRARHFCASSLEQDTGGCGMADPDVIRMMNPMSYCRGEKSDLAKYWRIRHGAKDCHTSWAIPLILAESLKETGVLVDFAFAWGRPHGGDYEMEEMFDWAISICK